MTRYYRDKQAIEGITQKNKKMDKERQLISLNDDDKNRMSTDKGNISFSAEAVARWLNLDVDYLEPHTAKHDAELEFMILCKAWATHKNTIKKHFL